MKARVNLTIDEEILAKAKYYAETHNTSVSEMVQEYLTKVSAQNAKPAFMQMIQNAKPKNDYSGRDLKKEYYEDKGKKYGI